MKALVGAFNQEKALVGAFSVIVQPVVEPMERYTALPVIAAPHEHLLHHTQLPVPDAVPVKLVCSLVDVLATQLVHIRTCSIKSLKVWQFYIFVEGRPGDESVHVRTEDDVRPIDQSLGVCRGVLVQAAEPCVEEYRGDGLQRPPVLVLQKVPSEGS